METHSQRTVRLRLGISSHRLRWMSCSCVPLLPHPRRMDQRGNKNADRRAPDTLAGMAGSGLTISLILSGRAIQCCQLGLILSKQIHDHINRSALFLCAWTHSNDVTMSRCFRTPFEHRTNSYGSVVLLQQILERFVGQFLKSRHNRYGLAASVCID
jgi:hypothetical protein